MTAPDVLRWADVTLALVLCVSCTLSMFWSADWDQASRFAVLFGYGVVTVGGQFNALGRPATWVTYLLVLVSLSAVVVTIRYAVKTWPRVRGDGGA